MDGKEPTGEIIEHEGERYLDMLDLREHADDDIVTSEGTIKARDFLDICGEHARPQLKTFVALGRDHPDYPAIKGALQSIIRTYIEGDSSS